MWAGALIVLYFTMQQDPQSGGFFGLWRIRAIGSAVLLLVFSGIPLFLAWSRAYCFKYLLALSQVGITIVVLEAIGVIGIVDYRSWFERLNSIPTNRLGSVPAPYIDERGETFQDIAHSLGLEHPPIPFHYKTGRYGFRNPTDPEGARIYLLGDSIVVGASVPYEETIAGRLAAIEAEPVLNIALVGISVQREQQLLRETGLPLRNRLVLQFVFEGNDLLDSRSFREAMNRQDSQDDTVWKRTFSFNALMLAGRLSSPSSASSGRRRYSCSIADQVYEFAWMSNSFVGFESEQKEIFDAIAQLDHDVKQQGGSLAVIFVPTKFRVLGHLCQFKDGEEFGFEENIGPLRTSILEWAADTSIPMLDVTEALVQETENGAAPFYWGDTHLTAVGHSVIANQIAAWSIFSEWHANARGDDLDQ